MSSRVLLLFFGGILLGRIVSEQASGGLVGAMDLVTYLALAFGIAWSWRAWARRALEARRREERRRRGSRPRKPRPETAVEDTEA